MATMTAAKAAKRTQGMNWCRPSTRLAIYLRDGLACVYCGATIEDGERLTLDHIRPYSQGGDNGVKNLVTCCHRCNSSRGARTLDHGVTAEAILAHVAACRRRTLPRDEARQLLARRGTVHAAIR